MEEWLEKALNCPDLIMLHGPGEMAAIELIGFDGLCTRNNSIITEADCKKCDYVTSETDWPR